MTTSYLIQRRLRRVVTDHSDAGFTLIEVVVSAFLFVVVSTAAVLAIVSSSRADDSTRNRVDATNLAQSDLEQARALALPASTTYTASPPGDTMSYSVTRSVTYPGAGSTCPAGGEIKVSVTVRWSGQGADSVRSDTVVACP